MNNSKELIQNIISKLFDYQHKLSDSEYKDLVEDLGLLYNSLSITPQPVNRPNCMCIFGYGCYSVNRFLNCNNKTLIIQRCPFIERLFYFKYTLSNDNLPLPVPFNPLTTYTIYQSPVTGSMSFSNSDINLFNFLKELAFNNSVTESLFITATSMFCFINYICKNVNILHHLNNFNNQSISQNNNIPNNVQHILERIINFLSNYLIRNQLIFDDYHIYIEDDIEELFEKYLIDFINIKNSVLSIPLDSDDEDDIPSIMVGRPRRRNLTPPRFTNISKHPMATRKQCYFTYKKKCTVDVYLNNTNQRITYDIGDRCKLKNINSCKYCEKHKPK